MALKPLCNVLACFGTKKQVHCAQPAKSEDYPVLLWVREDLTIATGGASAAAQLLFGQSVDTLPLQSLVARDFQALAEVCRGTLSTGTPCVFKDVAIWQQPSKSSSQACDLCLCPFLRATAASGRYLLITVGGPRPKDLDSSPPAPCAQDMTPRSESLQHVGALPPGQRQQRPTPSHITGHGMSGDLPTPGRGEGIRDSSHSSHVRRAPSPKSGAPESPRSEDKVKSRTQSVQDHAPESPGSEDEVESRRPSVQDDALQCPRSEEEERSQTARDEPPRSQEAIRSQTARDEPSRSEEEVRSHGQSGRDEASRSQGSEDEERSLSQPVMGEKEVRPQMQPDGVEGALSPRSHSAVSLHSAVSSQSAGSSQSEVIFSSLHQASVRDSLVYSMRSSSFDNFGSSSNRDSTPVQILEPETPLREFATLHVQTEIHWERHGFSCLRCAKPPLLPMPRASSDSARAMAVASKMNRRKKILTDDVWTLLREKEQNVPEGLLRLHITGNRFTDNLGNVGAVQRRGKEFFIEGCKVEFEGAYVFHIINPLGQKVTYTRGDGGRGLGVPLVHSVAAAPPQSPRASAARLEQEQEQDEEEDDEDDDEEWLPAWDPPQEESPVAERQRSKDSLPDRRTI